MKRHLGYLFFFTFLFGIFTGFFVFVETQGTHDTVPSGDTTFSPQSFEVLGYTYGGCERTGCMSYKLESDGSYTYITQGQDGHDRRYDDTLSAKQLADLRELMKTTTLKSVEQSVFRGTCPTSSGMNAYRYEIRIGNERYSVDTCVQSTGDIPLFSALAKYFEVFGLLYHS